MLDEVVRCVECIWVGTTCCYTMHMHSTKVQVINMLIRVLYIPGGAHVAL